MGGPLWARHAADGGVGRIVLTLDQCQWLVATLARRHGLPLGAGLVCARLRPPIMLGGALGMLEAVGVDVSIERFGAAAADAAASLRSGDLLVLDDARGSPGRSLALLLALDGAVARTCAPCAVTASTWAWPALQAAWSGLAVRTTRAARTP